MLEPVPMQAPLAARVDQAIANQDLQDITPARSFARVRQTGGPKVIEPELFVEFTSEPACAPLTRPMQLHRVEPHLHTMRPRMLGDGATGGNNASCVCRSEERRVGKECRSRW